MGLLTRGIVLSALVTVAFSISFAQSCETGSVYGCVSEGDCTSVGGFWCYEACSDISCDTPAFPRCAGQLYRRLYVLAFLLYQVGQGSNQSVGKPDRRK